MDLGLKGKTAIITGGASGLGRETALYFVREGVRVLIADQNAANIEKVLAELRAAGGEAEGIAADVRSHADCVKMAARAKEKFGSIDVLLAGAGVARDKFFAESAPEDWELMLEVNIRGVLNSCHAVIPQMIAQKGGAIVNIASEAGKVGEKRMSVYSATKGAVIGFTKALSVEMGRFGIRVNAVCPGVTMTPMTAGFSPEMLERSAKLYPLGRLGQPRDIASTITFLASAEASWITGQAISVSGGFGRS